jgi:hypothetical protein
MRPFLLSVALLLTIVANAQLTRKSYVFNGTTIWFYEYRTPGLPAGYKYPVIISLGGDGQKGDGSVNDMSMNLAGDGLPYLINHGFTMKFNLNGQQHGFIVVAPQLPKTEGGWPEVYTDGMINYVKSQYGTGQPVLIDPNKIFLTGFSLGGGGTWKYITSSAARAANIAGAIPISGNGDYNSANFCLVEQNNVPVWAFHSNSDPLIPSSNTTFAINGINACSPLTVPARSTIFPDGSHGSWNERVYADTTDLWHNPNIYEWMLRMSRTINPATNQPPMGVGLVKRLANQAQNLVLEVPVRTVDVRLDATGSTDPDDLIAEYLWTRGSETFPLYFIDPNYGYLLTPAPRPVVTLTNNPNGFSEWVEPGTYNYTLQVKDYKSQVSTVNVSLTVQRNATNSQPGAYIDNDNVILPSTQHTVTLFGKDKEWDIAAGDDIDTRNWRLVTGPGTVNITNNQRSADISGINVPGVYTFEYKVTDRRGGVGSGLGTVTLLAPLPITLSYFKGKNLNGNNQLSWATTSEINNDRFELLRSTDGVNFVVAGTVAANGNSSGGEYSFVDTKALKGTNYYRLKQVDKDGKSTLSKVIRIDNTNRTFVIEKYPNPANSILTVTIEGNTSNTIGVSIADMQGRIVEQQQWKKENTLLKKDISVAKLQSGLYQLIISFVDGKKEVTGFIKY